MQDLVSRLGKVSALRGLVKLVMREETEVKKVISAECVDTLFDVNFLDPHCLKLAISKVISYVMVLGAALYKVPTILNIMKSRKCTGFAENSLNLETTAYAADALYKFRSGLAFNVYGDSFINILVNCIIIYLFWHYDNADTKSSNMPRLIPVDSVDLLSKKLGKTNSDKDNASGRNNSTTAAVATPRKSIISLIICLVIIPCVCFHLPKAQIYYIGALVLLFFATSRFLQIVNNFTSGEVGVQSSVTLFLAAAGSVAKAFTNSVETKDNLLIRGSQLVGLLNVILFFQVFLYHRSNKSQKAHKD